MSNFTCPTCGLTNIDCGKAGYKTKREIELEEKVAAGVRREQLHLNRAFRAEKKLEIALSYLHTIKRLRNGKCFQCSDFAYRAIKKIKEYR